MNIEKFNHLVIDKKWHKIWDQKKHLKPLKIKTKRNIIVLKCSHIHPAKYIWAT